MTHQQGIKTFDLENILITDKEIDVSEIEAQFFSKAAGIPTLHVKQTVNILITLFVEPELAPVPGNPFESACRRANQQLSLSPSSSR